MTAETLASAMDSTNLRLDATDSAIVELCERALLHKFVCVVVYPTSIRLAASVVSGAEVGIGTVVGFPSGRFSTAAKLTEVEMAAQAGATEVDVVMDYAVLREGRDAQAGVELEVLSKRAHELNLLLKVIVETCYLDEGQRMIALHLCEQVGADFIKTSTGFGSAGADLKHIREWSFARSTGIEIKASGGIKSLSQVLNFLDAGATRVGTSSAVSIMAEFSGATAQRGRAEDGY